MLDTSPPVPQAGKGRTGTLIAAALLHERSSTSAEEALRVFGVRRTHNGKGVTLPSQQRYVHYYALQLAAAERAATAAAAVADGSSGGSFRVGGAGAVDARLESAPQSPASPSPPPQAPPPVQARHLSRSVLKEEKEAALEPCAWHVELELRHRGGSGAWGFSLGQGIEGGALGRCTIATVTPGSGNAFKGGSSGSVMLESAPRGDGEEGVEEWGPVCDFLHPGDEILSIGGTPVPVGAAGIRDAARMLLTRLARADKGAGVDARLRLLLLRRAPFGGAAAAPPPLSPPKGSQEFWERVACAVGPWAGTLLSPSPAHAAPVPTIRLCSVALTHAPMVRGSVGVISDFYWQLLSQAHCRSVVWDSRQGSGHVTPTGALAWLCNSNSSSGGGVCGSAPLFGGDFRLVLRHTRERKPLISTWLHTAFLPIPHAARVALGHARGQGGWGGGICGSEAPSTAASDAASVEDVCVCEEDRAAAVVATMGDDVSAMAASADGCPTLGAMLTAAGCAPYAPANATGEATVAPLRGAATLRMRHLDGAVKADRKGNVWHACARLVLAYELIL